MGCYCYILPEPEICDRCKEVRQKKEGNPALSDGVIELLIIAGDSPKDILEFIAKDIESGFCKYPGEFKEEWDGKEGTKYKLTLQIEKAL